MALRCLQDKVKFLKMTDFWLHLLALFLSCYVLTILNYLYFSIQAMPFNVSMTLLLQPLKCPSPSLDLGNSLYQLGFKGKKVNSYEFKKKRETYMDTGVSQEIEQGTAAHILWATREPEAWMLGGCFLSRACLCLNLCMSHNVKVIMVVFLWQKAENKAADSSPVSLSPKLRNPREGHWLACFWCPLVNQKCLA